MKRQTLRALAVALLAALPVGAADPPADPGAEIEATREALAKCMEASQAASKEKRDWQQTREILRARIERMKAEVDDLEQKIKQAETTVAEVNERKAALEAENEAVKATAQHLAETVAGFEAAIRQLAPRLPEPLLAKLKPLYDRIPADPKETKVSVAERFQNVLGIANELNRANNDIPIVFEVRNLANGKPAEVRTMYVGLAQAFFVSAGGEAGIGRPAADGWHWENAPDQAGSILLALEILQNKHKPAFVPLPVKIQ